jgi:hypothetical protein
MSCELFSRKVVIWQKVEAVGSVTNNRLLRATGVSFYGCLSVEVRLSWCTDAVLFKSEWRNFDHEIIRCSSARYRSAGGLLMKFPTRFEFRHFSSACSRNFQLLVRLQSEQERHVPSELHPWPRHRVAHPRCVVTEHLSQWVAIWISLWGAHGRCVCRRPNNKWLPSLGI